AGIGQLSNIVVAAERDQQSGDSFITQLRILKNRFSGTCGLAGKLIWDTTTGRLLNYDVFENDAEETDKAKQAPQF
ncbi:MAG: DnaB-like helicase C-terminal domain-containing protein, partial [Planctomycetota bacterium]